MLYGCSGVTMVATEEYESLETLQSLFRDPEAQERLSNLGVRTALVATWDGLLIDSVVCDDEPVELEMLAANAAAALQLSHTDRPARGRVDGVMAEFDGGSTIIVDPVGDNTLVAFVANPASDVVQLRAELRTMAQLAVSGGAAPFVTPSIHDSARPAPAVPPSSAPRPEAAAPGAAARHAPAPVMPRPAAPSPAPARATQSGAPAVADIVRNTPAGRRVILKGVTLDAAGHAATASVELALNGRKVVGKAVARNDSAQYMFVAAEAAVRAVSELLPDGYGVVLEHIMPVASEVDQSIRAISVKVLFLTPAGEQTLLGIAKIAGNEPMAAAKTVLSAVNGSIEILIGQTADQVH